MKSTGAEYWRPPHIHYDITGRVNRLITQMYFPDEPLNRKDPLLQQSWAKESFFRPPDSILQIG